MLGDFDALHPHTRVCGAARRTRNHWLTRVLTSLSTSQPDASGRHTTS